ncbi:efflux transporter outer membrane subunit [Dyella flava]|uniref:Efflux transporter outer membrane subunit n=1 Tax=Dyella flava TaxID=1920170 RepID=A0ABS2K2D6_9GAMM|nr:efflux transporter outer membrane subunit [Dyella flava]MBM7125289.1 efflux transporter outer membrane subunit [Dyella flava]GLQ50664.1 outer membrane efflux lipoprotein [Dyella flava]
MNMRKQRISRVCLFVAGLSLAGLAGCTPGPAYVRPSVSVPAHYKEVSPVDAKPPQGWLSAQPSDADRGEWWDVFGDPTLNALEAKVTVGNQTIKKSLADLQQAQAMVGVERSAYMPFVTADVSADVNHTSKDVVGRSLAGKTVQDYAMGVTASWEPDLFDRIGHAVDAAKAREQASEEDLASVSLSMHAELALDYADLRQLDVEAALLGQLVNDYTQAKALVQTQFDGGIASESELQQAETQLEVAKAQLIDLGEARAQREHAIAVLMGIPPADFTLAPVQQPLPLPVIPPGLPSTLLERRPDIAAAERRVAAANADVGEATSAFFPDLVLSASGGFESSKFAQWATLPSRFWAIGPALVGTLFDGGRRREELSAAEARQDAAAADYRQTVLSAFQEVEDNLASVHVLADESVAQQRAVDASSQAAQLAMTRYQDGATDYLEVVSTQSVNLAQTRAQVELSRRRFAADIRLIKALGGTWSGRDE